MSKIKVFKIAKELNLATTTILDYLQKEMKVDVSKGINTSLEEDGYLSVLKHFKPGAYQQAVADSKKEESGKVVSEKRLDIKSRSEELNQILNSATTGTEERKEEKDKHSSRRLKKSSFMEEELGESSLVETEVVVAEEKAPAVAPAKSEPVQTPPVEERREHKHHDQERKHHHDKGKREGVAEVAVPEDGFAKKNSSGKSFESDNKVDKTAAKPGKDNLKRKKGKNLFPTTEETPAAGGFKHKKKKHKTVDQGQVNDAVKETLRSMADDSAKSFKKKKKKRAEEDGQEIEIEVNVITATEYISTSELASKLGVNVSEVIARCFGMGLMITINQRLDKETIELIASEYNFEVEFESEFEEEMLASVEEVENEEELESRPPVVTIMGHVDHGKTSLLDYIRNTRVVAGEAGGITQHIGAYEVVYNEKHITFLDTPGHEAFTAMRARGAKVTDIVVIVVAADDRVMPQTIEAIDHAKAAGVKIIIAINKIDKHTADPQKIRTELSQHNILVEDWGGKYQCAEISAKTGIGVDSLLEMILIEAEMLELKANPKVKARGSVVDSRLDKGLGSVATILVQKGTLKPGDIFVCGQWSGRVRALFNERMKRIDSAGPAFPAMVLGFSGTPAAGDTLIVVDSEHEAKEIASRRQQLNRIHSQQKSKVFTLDQISEKIKLGQVKELNLIIKGDVDGSIEAISDSLMKLSNQEVAVRLIHKSVGTITESDVLLAKASDAIVVGFNVRPNLKARDLAEKEHVEIRQYSIIYSLIEEVKQALEGMLSPEISEEVVATLEVRATFKVPKIGTIAGCYVLSGKIHRNSKVRLIRNDVQIYQGKLSSLKRHKDDVKEVMPGFECGVGIENYNDLKEGDIIEVYEIRETQRKLD